MKTSQKVAISLLLTVLLGGAGTFLAFSGLFDYVEARFYQSKLQTQILLDLEKLKEGALSFEESLSLQFSSLLDNPFIRRNFIPNQSQEDIFSTEDGFLQLKRKIPGLLFARLIDLEGKIHYSTLEEDYQADGRYKRIYRRLDEAEEKFGFEELTINAPYTVFNDESGQFYVFSLPVVDSLTDSRIGTGLFYVSVKGLQQYLLKEGFIGLGEDLQITPRGSVVSTGGSKNLVSRESLDQFWSSGERNEFTLLGETGEGEDRLYLVSGNLSFERKIGYIFFGKLLTLSNSLKYLLLGSFYLTLFLVVFLVFSFSQDKTVVVADRIKRFQINFLKQYIDNKESLNWETWRKELDAKKEVINKQIKKGLGRLNTEKAGEVDQLLASSWEEIFRVLGERSGPVLESSADLVNIESMLKKVLSDPQLVINAKTGSDVPVSKPAVKKLPVEVTAEREEAEELEEAEGTSENYHDGIPPSSVHEHIQASLKKYEDVEPLDLQEIFYEQNELGDIEVFDDMEDFEDYTPTEALEELALIDDGAEVLELEVLEEVESFDTAEEAELLSVLVSEEPGSGEALEELAVYVPPPLSLVPLEVEARDSDLGELSEVDVDDNRIYNLQDNGPFNRELFFFSDRGTQVLRKVASGYDDLKYPSGKGGLDTGKSRKPKESESFGLKDIIEKLVKQGMLEVMPLEAFQVKNSQEIEAIILKDGLYQISDDVYREDSLPAKNELGALAYSVLEDEIESDERIDLFASNTVDLSSLGFLLPEESDTRRLDEGHQINELFSPGMGLNLDFLKNMMPSSVIKDVKILMRLSSITDSLMAALLVESEDGLKVASSVGMEDQGKEMLRFSPTDEVYEELFKTRRVVMEKKARIGFKDLDDRIPAHYDDFISGVLYLPVMVDQGPGYIFLGLKGNQNSIPDYITALKKAFT